MQYFKNIITVILSTLLLIVILQIIFHLQMLKIAHQNKMSRSILYNLDFYYHTFYPNIFDRNLKDTTLVLGDSYAMGQGDGWLYDDYNYSSLHFLHNNNKKNYLNFGKPGGRSITSFREFFYRYNQINSSLFLPKIHSPKEMIFFFYEGNDLIDNYKFYKKNNKEKLSEKNFVFNEIENYENYKFRKLNIYFPLISASKNILLEKFIHHFYLPYARKKLEKKNLEKKYNNKKIKETILNEIYLNKETFKVEGNIENPGYFLNEEELEISINIFFNCIKYFKSKFPKTNITVLYIPSPASIYNWSNGLKIKNENNEITNISKKEILETNNYIISKFKYYLSKESVNFINSTEKFREFSVYEFLHGEHDKDHFNVRGYQIMSDILLNN